MIKKIIAGCVSPLSKMDIDICMDYENANDLDVFMVKVNETSSLSIANILNGKDSINDYIKQLDTIIYNLNLDFYGIIDLDGKEMLGYYFILISNIKVLQHFGRLKRDKNNYIKIS